MAEEEFETETDDLFAMLDIEFEDSERTHSAKMRIKRERSGKKAIWINSVPINKLSRLMSYLNVVMFSPEDLILVKGGPAERRRFMDMEISQLKPAYYYDLQQYNQALKQRNNLLKEGLEKQHKSQGMQSA